MLKRAAGLRARRRALLKLAALTPLVLAARGATAATRPKPPKRGYRPTRHIRTAYRLARF